MADNSRIEWCHATVNAISGCTPISPGCTNCYAMRVGGFNRPHHPSNGLTTLTRAGHVWTGAVRLNDAWLRRPLTWQKPRRIFWNAHGDAWHESVPVEWIDRELAVAALTPHHRHLFLTKRSTHMRRYFEDPATPERVLDRCKDLGGLPQRWQWPLPNVWLGVSVEDQARADERIPDLLATPAAKRWLSCEPLIGRVQIPEYLPNPLWNDVPSWKSPEIDWVVVGGESGLGARPMHLGWAQSLRDQCAHASVPFLFKQWGEWFPYGGVDDDGCVVTVTRGAHPASWHEWGAGEGFSVRLGRRAAGRRLDGAMYDQYPELFPWEKAREEVDA